MKIWTKTELEFLIDNYPNKGAKYCAEKLNRSLGSIELKTHRLKLKSKANIQRKTHEQYLQDLVNKNITYKPLESYRGNKFSILHVCNIGHEWKARPNDILDNHGCPICKSTLKTHDQYENELMNLEVPFYPLEKYVNAFTPILHECLNGHTWKINPVNAIFNGEGCPICSKTGFDITKPAILYYVKIIKDNEIYYKIGISNNTLNKRFKAETDKEIVPLMIENHAIGQHALDKEQEILEKFDSLRVNISGFLKSGGNTELFEIDILNLDK